MGKQENLGKVIGDSMDKLGNSINVALDKLGDSIDETLTGMGNSLRTKEEIEEQKEKDLETPPEDVILYPCSKCGRRQVINDRTEDGVIVVEEKYTRTEKKVHYVCRSCGFEWTGME